MRCYQECRGIPTIFRIDAMIISKKKLLSVLFISMAFVNALGQSVTEFANPGSEYRPWVYWFFNNGNLTKEGIDADLEAMHRVGIGGALIMEVNQGAPRGPVDFMSDQWREHFKYLIQKAASLGIQVNMNTGPSWNGSGGPWIKPENAMKELSIGIVEVSSDNRPEKIILPKGHINFDYYEDICVLAFPTPKAKTGLGFLNVYTSRLDVPVSDFPVEAFIPLEDITDLTSKMNEAGEISDGIPAGNQTLIRFGFTCRKQFSAPAPESVSQALECDKLSKRGIEAAFAGQIAKLTAENREHVGTTFVSAHIDSWENGSQNWSHEMREEFLKRRKYDILKFLPVFAGYLMENAAYTDRFLWDFRCTVSELVAENYAGRMKELAAQSGLRFTVESYWDTPCDNIQYAGMSDEPMGEFWANANVKYGVHHNMMLTCRGMASAGHIYGKNIIGAEAFTANDDERWLLHPGSLKALGDKAFSEGINRFVFHRYSFQPWKDVKPGLMMGPWGIHYERTQTWWELTPAWHEYLSRCHYMLRQGKYAADILYIEPEESPQMFTDHPRIGYQWDQGNTDVVLKASVKDGSLVLPGGMQYKIMVLPQTHRMTTELLEKTLQLVQEGLTVIGDCRASTSPSLSGFPDNERRIEELTRKLWGDVQTPCGVHPVGKGKVVWGISPEALLKEMGIAPNLLSDVRLNWIHRSLPDAEIFFVANPHKQDILTKIQIRGLGITELWDPETGELSPTYSFQTDTGNTLLTLSLPETKSVFIVLRKPTPENKSDTKFQQLVGLTKEGKKIFDMREEPCKITILSAEYGLLADPAKTVDVKPLIEKMVASGERRIIIDQMKEQQGDPAANLVKTLTIDYEMDGKRYSVTGNDSEAVVLGSMLPKVKILNAKYITWSKAESPDLRERLQHFFDRGENNFSLPRLMQPGDPVSLTGFYKGIDALSFDYEIDGKKFVWNATTWLDTYMEGSTVLLNEPVNAPVAVTSHNGSGQPCIDFLESGNYELIFTSNKKRKEKVLLPAPLNLDNDWTVDFPHKTVTFNKLVSWSESTDESIQFFSGTATYTKTFTIPKNFGQKGLRLILDLGKAEMIAQIELNGKDLGVLWKMEKSIDITELVKTGENCLKISVTNSWPNRLIGDAHLPPSDDRNENGSLKAWPQWLSDGKPDPNGRSTFSMWNIWRKDDALIPSGLMGPVRLSPVKRVVVE